MPSILSLLWSKGLSVLLVGLFISILYRIVQPYSTIWRLELAVDTFYDSQQARLIRTMASNNTSKRMPVYFLGIGGPNFMEDKQHPAYHRLAETGLEITQKVQPNAVVVFSAHWQGGPSTIQINVAEKTDLIYDFYGFPPHYYEYDYPNRGSREVALKVMEKLSAKSINVEPVKRGLDHGVWVGFLAAFDPKKNPLNVPIVEVSIFGSEESDQHYRLGEALQSLRDEGILIVGAGMAVHNLQDYRATLASGKTMPYAYTFDEALKRVTTAPPEERRSKMAELMKQRVAREAHPTFEHILPLHVAAGAAGEDVGERLWTLPERSLSWAQYRFGSV